MSLSDDIANLINDMISRSDGELELKRNDLANKLGCVPSQINYVITSRFTPEKGYIIESHRGGGGYIKIIRVKMHREEYLMHLFQTVGNSLDEKTLIIYARNLLSRDFITTREYNLLKVLNTYIDDDIKRANAFRHSLLSIMN